MYGNNSIYTGNSICSLSASAGDRISGSRSFDNNGATCSSSSEFGECGVLRDEDDEITTPNLWQRKSDRYHNPANATTLSQYNKINPFEGLTSSIATRETPKRIPQRPIITLPTNLYIHHNPQTTQPRSITTNSVISYILQIRIANGKEVRSGFARKVFHACENNSGSCKADAETEQGGVQRVELLGTGLGKSQVMLRWVTELNGGEKGDKSDGQDWEDNGDEEEEWEAEFCGSVGVGKAHVEDTEGVEIRIDI
jgi:hypothetical protein